MSKIDFRREILPDIEMYGGSTDDWELPLYNPDGKRFLYSEIKLYVFTLIIKDYGYTHRSNGETYFTLEKTGMLIIDDDQQSALVRFHFDKSDTYDRYGKYTYQVVAQYADDYHTAQGNLFITKNIDQ